MADEHKPEATRGDVATEIQELGRQFEAAIRAAVTSTRAQELQAEIIRSVEEIGKQLEAATKAAVDSQRTKDVTEQAKKVVETAQEHKVVQDIRENLVRGLQTLNEELRKAVDRMERKDPTQPPPTAEDPLQPSGD
ncbi:MAG: hypothetical protein A2Z04_03390 [Chloroflexi bacterium RBG_16_57_9]|nr:MAG: hypothetical protein A2Z04_03390 [Chloroflexi bacterium RBG_16_57_9]